MAKQSKLAEFARKVGARIWEELNMCCSTQESKKTNSVYMDYGVFDVRLSDHDVNKQNRRAYNFINNTSERVVENKKFYPMTEEGVESFVFDVKERFGEVSLPEPLKKISSTKIEKDNKYYIQYQDYPLYLKRQWSKTVKYDQLQVVMDHMAYKEPMETLEQLSMMLTDKKGGHTFTKREYDQITLDNPDLDGKLKLIEI